MTDYRDSDLHRTFIFNAEQLRERTQTDLLIGAVIGFCVAVALHLVGAI